MLRSTSYRDVKVIDIAREAGTSPATFYQYFPDVEAAILVLAEQMAQDGQRLPALIREGTWRGKAGIETATRLCQAFFDFWEEYRSILRVMDLATEEGDRRFHQIRTRLLNEVNVALSSRTRAASRATSSRRRQRPCSCRCSPTWPPTSTASSSGASGRRTCATAWPARSTGASLARSCREARSQVGRSRRWGEAQAAARQHVRTSRGRVSSRRD